jgi:dephospho-CoA kinase
MLKVGLTGGLGCGKSFVAEELERLGCRVIHADRLGHEVLMPEGPAYGPVVELFGTAVLRADGEIDRARLASIVFEDSEKLVQLNAIVHPAVRQRENEIFASIAREDRHAIAVLEAAILIENNSYRDYDKLIVVWCDPGLQVERAMERDPHADSVTVAARLANQIPVLDKRRYGDFLIETNGTIGDTLRQTQEVFAELVTIERAYER